MTRAVVLLLAATVLLAPAVARGQSGPLPPPSVSALPLAMQKVDVEERLGFPLPAGLVFTDEASNQVRLEDQFKDGKPVILILGYYHCPMLCELIWESTIKAMKGIDLELGKDYRALTVSFDKRDRAVDAQRKQTNVLAALGLPGMEPHWRFVVGSEDATARLANAVGYGFAWDEQTQQYAHPAVVIVLTPDGRVSRYLYGVEYRPRDLKLALVEAGQGRTGSFADKVIMSCFRYDPGSRRYGVYIFGILRLGSVAIVLALGGYLFHLWRRDRREHSAARRL